MKIGWSRVPFLEALVDVSSGNVKTPQTEYLPKGLYPVVDQGHHLVAGYTNEASRLCNVSLPAIVFGDHTRAFKYLDFPFCMGADGVKVLRPKGDADTRYLYHYLRYLPLTNGGYERHYKYLRRTDVLLPSLPEQRRIAEVLDSAQALRAKRQATLARLNEITQSIFFEMFGDPVTNPKGWERVPFGQLLADIESGQSPICLDRPVVANEWGVLKLGAVTRCEYKSAENKALPVGIEPNPALEVQPGDLLFTRKNTYELVGACALVEETPPRLLLPDLMFRFRLCTDAGITSSYLHQLLIYPTKRRVIQALAGGSAGSMPNISKERLRTASIERPPLALQAEFARRVIRIKAMNASLQASSCYLDTLFASLQYRAFRGEL